MKPGVSFPVRCYLAWLRWLQRGVSLMQALGAGFWLGVLRRQDLEQVDTEYYNRQSMYQDATYNRSGLSWWEREALEKYFGRSGRLLVTSVGGGRELLALRSMGYEADGFECNPTLVKYANGLLAEQGFSPSVYASERDCCPTLYGPYDGVIVGWGSFMLMQGQHRRLQFLREMRALVNPGAPILLSFIPRKGDRKRLALIKGTGNVFRRLSGRELLELGDDLSPNYIHHCDRAGVENTLANAGFRMVQFDVKDYGHAVGLAVPPAADPSGKDETRAGMEARALLS
jgi:hypothetical protein